MNYGHSGLAFNADKALKIGELRDRRFQETYDKILLRCLKQVQECCAQQKSTIYEVPLLLTADLLPYQTDEVMQYLIVALRDDRHFHVLQIDGRRLYIRWGSTDDKAAAVEPPPPPKKTLKKATAVATTTQADLDDIDRLIRQLG